ncbi:glycosyltransferase family 87 protein [Edaphobacter bradus]|uniref:glycosyltransferase family 87 protein n=1 Tax=Edaphobacter bradus TaxID=2259016 RepID=UPI0021DFB7D1|nr:glycosyltransferase family 87 protein [Edaphobacter bradus]
MRSPENREGELALSSEAVLLLGIVAGFCWFALLVFSHTATLDFSALYAAGGLIVEGHRRQLFDLATQAEFQRRVLGMPAPLPFLHLAYEALIFAPLALLPFRLALWVWRLMCLAMLVGSCRSLGEVFYARRRDIALLALALFPVALAIVQGQDSVLLLLLFSGALVAVERRKDGLGGALLGCALFKPQLVLPLAVILVLKRGARFAWGLLAACVACVLLSLAITGMRGWHEMVDLMRYAGSAAGEEIGATSWARPNLRGLLDLLGMNAKTTVELAVALSAILLLAVAWRLRNCSDARSLFPPMIALTLIVSLNVNLHDFTLLLIPVMAMLETGTRRAYLCVGACFCMPVLMFMGHLVFFVLLVAVLVVTVTAPLTEERQQRAVNT